MEHAFSIRVRADPQALARLVNYFAQRALVPSEVHAIQNDGFIAVVIEQMGLDNREAELIAQKMRASPLVMDVTLTRLCRAGHQDKCI